MHEKKTKTKIISGFIILLILSGIYTIRPLFHPFFMWFYRNPYLIEALTISLIAAFLPEIFRLLRLTAVYSRIREHGYECRMGASHVILAVLLAVFFGIFAAFYPKVWVAQHTVVNEVSEIPSVDLDIPRFLPKYVAYRYAKDALETPRYKLGRGAIVVYNSSLVWMYPLVPDGVINYFKLKDSGVLYVKADTYEKTSGFVEKTMEVGPGMGVTDNVMWRVLKKRYWVDYNGMYLLPDDRGEIYIVLPRISYEIHFRPPVFFTVPKYDGITLVDSSGNIKFLSPEEAEGLELLKGNRLYPESLARYYVDSLNFRHGIRNVLFYHRDQFEITDVKSDKEKGILGNPQPYLIFTERGLYWFTSVEPYGESHGIYRIFLVDARNGRIFSKKLPKKELLIGPVRACNYVKKANPVVDWTNFVEAEPLPVMVNGRLYWQVAVVPRGFSGIAYLAYVDAKTAEVTEAKNVNQAKALLLGKYAGEATENREAAEQEDIKALIEEIEVLLKKLKKKLNVTA